MPTQPYYLEGKRVPGVTSVLDKDVDGLLHWAYQAGRDGKDWKELRQAAADAGTACHEMAECDFHGKPFDRTKYTQEILEKADHAFQGFVKWKEQTKLRVIKSELPLVSKLGFGGCMDAVAIDSVLYLMDYKTSNSLREDMLVQVGGGYSLLWEEHFPDQPLEGMQILRFSKPHEATDPVSFHVHHYSKEIFPLAQQEFLNRLSSYRNRARLKKLI
jgi:hypothetical protein